MQSISTVPSANVEQRPALSLDAPRRLALVQVTLAAAMAGGLLLSRTLWLASRDYPLTPVAESLPVVGAPWDHIWWATLLALLATMALLPASRWPARLFLVLIVPLAAMDQTRWQPWVYQYLVMMGVLALSGPAAARQSERDNAPLNAFRLIIVMTYIYSGLQKCNASFNDDLGPWLVQPLLDSLETPAVMWVKENPFVLAVAEIGTGLGLLIPKVRRVAVALAVGMHATILFVLGPLGHNSNCIVWPWNLAMMAFVPMLFVGSRGWPWHVLWPGRSVAHWLAAVLFGILPVLNFWDRWDSYLSLALYSGNTVTAEVELRQNLYDVLPERARKRSSFTNGVYYPLDLWSWSMDELNVPPYPARRVYLSIARQLGARAERPDDCVLVIQERPHYSSIERETTRINCGR